MPCVKKCPFDDAQTLKIECEILRTLRGQGATDLRSRSLAGRIMFIFQSRNMKRCNAAYHLLDFFRRRFSCWSVKSNRLTSYECVVFWQCLNLDQPVSLEVGYLLRLCWSRWPGSCGRRRHDPGVVGEKESMTRFRTMMIIVGNLTTNMSWRWQTINITLWTTQGLPVVYFAS